MARFTVTANQRESAGATVSQERHLEQTLSIWWAAAFSTVACGLALLGSLLRPVWHDELYTLWLARMPLSDLLGALRLDSGPPLHYLICHVLFEIVDWPEGSALGTFMVRLPSVLAFSMMPWVLWRWARGRGTVIFWATALTMTWLPMLYFATEARAYALLALVNAVLWLLGPDLVESGGRRLVLFAVLAAALPMLHYTGLVSFCLLPTLALFIPRSKWRSFAAALAAAALPVLAWSPAILGAPSDSMKWVDTSSGPGRPGVVSLEVLSPAGPFPALFESEASPIPTVLSVAVLIVMLAALVFGAVKTFRRRIQGNERLHSIIGQTIGLMPAVVLGCLGLVGWPVYFAGRTESMVWLLLASLVGVSVLAIPRIARRACVSPYVAMGLVTIGLWMGGLPSRPDAIGVQVGRELAGALQPKDRVVVVGLWQLEIQHGLAEAVAYASGNFQTSVAVETLPRSQADHPGWFDLQAAADSMSLVQEAGDLRRQVEAEGGRVWLVWSPALALDRKVLPSFEGWQRVGIGADPVIAVELLVPPMSNN